MAVHGTHAPVRKRNNCPHARTHARTHWHQPPARALVAMIGRYENIMINEKQCDGDDGWWRRRAVRHDKTTSSSTVGRLAGRSPERLDSDERHARTRCAKKRALILSTCRLGSRRVSRLRPTGFDRLEMTDARGPFFNRGSRSKIKFYHDMLILTPPLEIVQIVDAI